MPPDPPQLPVVPRGTVYQPAPGAGEGMDFLSIIRRAEQHFQTQAAVNASQQRINGVLPGGGGIPGGGGQVLPGVFPGGQGFPGGPGGAGFPGGGGIDPRTGQPLTPQQIAEIQHQQLRDRFTPANELRLSNLTGGYSSYCGWRLFRTGITEAYLPQFATDGNHLPNAGRYYANPTAIPRGYQVINNGTQVMNVANGQIFAVGENGVVNLTRPLGVAPPTAPFTPAGYLTYNPTLTSIEGHTINATRVVRQLEDGSIIVRNTFGGLSRVAAANIPPGFSLPIPPVRGIGAPPITVTGTPPAATGTVANTADDAVALTARSRLARSGLFGRLAAFRNGGQLLATEGAAASRVGFRTVAGRALGVAGLGLSGWGVVDGYTHVETLEAHIRNTINTAALELRAEYRRTAQQLEREVTNDQINQWITEDLSSREIGLIESGQRNIFNQDGSLKSNVRLAGEGARMIGGATEAAHINTGGTIGGTVAGAALFGGPAGWAIGAGALGGGFVGYHVDRWLGGSGRLGAAIGAGAGGLLAMGGLVALGICTGPVGWAALGAVAIGAGIGGLISMGVNAYRSGNGWLGRTLRTIFG